jgi:hypothetical protein
MKLLLTVVVVVALFNMSLADQKAAKNEEKIVEKTIEKPIEKLEKKVEEIEPKSEPTTASPLDFLKPKRAKSPIHPLGQNRLNSNIARADTNVETSTSAPTTTPAPAPAPRVSNNSPASFKSSHILALVPALAAIAKLF